MRDSSVDEAYRYRSDGRTEWCLSIGHIGEDGNEPPGALELAVDDVVGAALRTERAAGGGLTLAIAGPNQSVRREKKMRGFSRSAKWTSSGQTP
jgi:hypothetical protein